jgi:hypothetical protein
MSEPVSTEKSLGVYCGEQSVAGSDRGARISGISGLFICLHLVFFCGSTGGGS